jgi:hypothetical protein
MARKPAPVQTPVAAAPKAAAVAAKPVASTPVRHSAIPKATPTAAKPVITHEAIAKRAFEISCGPNCGSEFDNWLRAERELRG